MNARRTALTLAVLAALILALLLLHSRSRSRSHLPTGSAQSVDAVTDPVPSPPVGVTATPPAPVDHTVRDRARRDEVRRWIYQSWSAVDAARVDPSAPRVNSERAPDPRYAPMPHHDGSVDPDYLRERIREDFVPMARACYEQLLTRRPGADGRVTMAFTVVGDSRVGGVVDEASVDTGDGGLTEPEFETCVRESMMAMAFRPPPGEGSIRVHYPISFRPDAQDAAAQ